MGGNEVRRNSRRGVRLGLCLAVAAVLGTVGLTTASGASVPTADEGVTGKTIKLGFIYPATGVAASISQNGLEAFQARIDRQNAEGGVNGRKIEVVSRDDASSGANLTAAQDLVENQHVFAVVNESPFAFLSYRWLLDHNVPMIGNGVDGTYYQQKGNEDILSSTGNGNPFGDLTYDFPARIMKMLGVKKVGVLAYGAASSSVASAKAFMNYAVPEVGLDPAYTNTSVDFGSSDVGAAGARHQERGRRRRVPADGGGDERRGRAGTAAERRRHEGGDHGAPATGRTSSTPRRRRRCPTSAFFSVGGKPVEVKDAATKQFQADLKKYANFTGVPDYGMYTGYILADYAIDGLQKAGNPPTRQGLIDGAHSIGTVRPGRPGLPAGRRRASPVAARRRRRAAATSCS